MVRQKSYLLTGMTARRAEIKRVGSSRILRCCSMCIKNPDAVFGFVRHALVEPFDKRPCTLVVPHRDKSESPEKLQLPARTPRIFSSRRRRLTSELADSLRFVPLLNTTSGSDASPLPCAEMVSGLVFK